MKDCHDDMKAFQKEEVLLREADRTDMRKRRDANRDRLDSGLKSDEEPNTYDKVVQGSYAMRTMIQNKDKDYDIDDGVYFLKSELLGPRGADRSAAAVKEMVRKAVHDDKFKTAPDVRTNCVRVFYDEGYHVDLPVYRVTGEANGDDEKEEKYELASSDWKESNPQKVTEWFKKENSSQSPDTEDGRQLRRVTRLIKKFSRSRDSWKSRIASGFVISKLVTEAYSVNKDREDTALYDTMKAIRNRLNDDLEVDHPVLNEKLTNGADDAKTKYLRTKLTDALADLNVLFEHDCSTEQARKAWDKVFKTDFFSKRSGGDDDNGGNGGGKASAAILSEKGEGARAAVNKDGGGTYASKYE